MRKIFLLAMLPLFISCLPDSGTEEFNAVQYVDPQIGSVHGRWFFYTPAALPFGMAKLAPHTNAYESMGSWLPGGYDDRHGSIEGFGHFHEFQVGGVVVMPFTGEIRTSPGTLENPDEGYRSRFDKADEHSEAGYYSVLLKDYQVKVELTATERVGFHRYTFPESGSSGILFDIGHKQGESSDVTEAYAQLVENREVEGFVETYPEYAKFCDPGKRVKMYFVARLSKEPEEVGIFYDSLVFRDSIATRGIGNGLYLLFSTSENEVLEMQVGLSYTSLENARLNLDTETKGLSFDQVKGQAKGKWNEMLGRILVEGSNSQDIKKFYTGLYHALLGRGLASDVNGQYVRNDGGIGQIPLDQEAYPRYSHYNTDGIWGGFWNLGQLWALVYPDYLVEYVQSNIDFYGETGWLHDGVAAGVFTNGVQTNFQGLLMAAAYNCGIRGFDLEKGYEAAYKNETEASGRNLGNGKYDMHWFNRLDYVPYWDTTLSNGWVFNFGSSHTLEYCFSSYAVAQMAMGLGKEDDYGKLMEQAGYWRNLFDPETRFIRPKHPDGSFLEDFDPMEGWRGFQEGNAFQYTWYVPHDIAGLMKAVGEDLFNDRLEQMFMDAQKSVFGGGTEIHSFSGVNMLYNHGNQPCLHNAWLFNYSGKPWLTQKWTRTICNEFYGTGPLHGYGYGQDEDQGQLGAWYVMAALGLFDVQGHAAAEPTFQFGSPLFEKVSLHLGGDPDNILEIRAENQDPGNFYIQALELNGIPVEHCWIPRKELMQRGILTFTLGPEPNREWGSGTSPPSMSSAQSGSADPGS
jgi:predicted alpha-1,2-mannosidase